jgi:hypothetical protein
MTMRAGVNNRGNQRIPWQFTSACAIKKAARFDACNVKNGPDHYDRVRIEMANAGLYRQGRILSRRTGDERRAFMEARP